MDVTEALEILGIASLDEVTEDSLKKAFRTLMKKHHPDKYATQPEEAEKHAKIARKINEANEVLTKILKDIVAIRNFERMTRREEIFSIIPLAGLFKLYSGEKIKLGSENNIFELTSGNIRLHRIYLCIDCSLEINGVYTGYSCIKPAIYTDEYSIDCEIPVVNLDEIEVTVHAYDKTVKLNMQTPSTTLLLRLPNNIKLKINIRKRLLSKED